jgi:hypothetical protein
LIGAWGLQPMPLKSTAQVNMMRKIGTMITIAALALMAGCGGNGASSFASSSSSSSSSGGNTVATAITLVSTAPQIPSDNATPATITAVVTNANNSVVTGAPVVFSTTSGIISPSVTTSGVAAGTTDQNGEAAAVLTTPGDPTNRTITVTAQVGTVKQTLQVAVVGTKLSLSGPASLIQGAVGTFSAALQDSGGNAIAGATVMITSAKGNALSAASMATDSTGHINFTVTGSNAGADTITVSALGLSQAQALSVSSQSFNITVPSSNANVALNTAQTVTLVWTNSGVPVANTAVSFSTTRGLFTGNVTTISTVTDGTGTASVSISSASAGPAVITASGAGVSSQVTISFVATDPSQIDVQASPATVQVSGSSTVTAIVRDSQNNLVANQTVDFQLTDKTGGSISQATGITDSQGRAQTVYTATSVASSANGVTITATVQGTTIQGSVNLTVGGQTVFLSLGTGATISENAAKTQFILPYVIQALDSAGNAVAGVTVTLDVHSLPPSGAPPLAGPLYNTTDAYAAYRKGVYVDSSTDAACTTGWCLAVTAECLNEDAAGTGIYEISEDLNGNGKLDPGDVAAVSPGSVTTDSTGTANVNVTYPEDHANWVQVLLTATTTVAGTQTSTTSQFWLPILATYVATTTSSPPGFTSPYGVSNNCANPN